MSELVGNPEDWFSRIAAHMSHVMRNANIWQRQKTKTQPGQPCVPKALSQGMDPVVPGHGIPR